MAGKILDERFFQTEVCATDTTCLGAYLGYHLIQQFSTDFLWHTGMSQKVHRWVTAVCSRAIENHRKTLPGPVALFACRKGLFLHLFEVFFEDVS